jgi:hypothetical protein
MLAAVNDTLRAKGLLLKAGTVVDATLIAAPSSTKIGYAAPPVGCIAASAIASRLASPDERAPLPAACARSCRTYGLIARA